MLGFIYGLPVIEPRLSSTNQHQLLQSVCFKMASNSLFMYFAQKQLRKICKKNREREREEERERERGREKREKGGLIECLSALLKICK